MTLILIAVPTRNSGTVDIIGERVSDNFALTPALVDRDGDTGITDAIHLTHISTGRTISTSMWLDLRDLAARLEKLPIDWTTLTTFSAEQAELVRAVVKESQQAHSDRGEEDWPTWAGDPAAPATSLLGTVLGDEAKQWDRFQSGRDLAAEVAMADADLGRKVETEISWRTASANVNGYGTAYLLAVLQRVNPEAADQAARDLAAAWQYGDGLGEWLFQWRKELSEGQPLTLHGFADVYLPAEEN